MARGLMGVKADLSEFGRHLLDVACFLPPSTAANYNDSPPASPHGDDPNPSSQRQLQQPRVVAGILRDLAEFGGSLRTGITKLSGDLMRKVAAGGGGVREEVLQFVKRDLVKSPESWLDFSMPLDDDFGMSRSQRDHVAMVEHLAPDLPTLRMSLCPRFMSENRFWKIYFALLLPKLNEFEAEFLSTQLIVEEMSINREKMKNRLKPEPLNAVAESSSTASEEIDTEQEMRCGILENKRQNRLNSGSQNRNSESQNLMAESSSSTATENAGDTAQGADQSQVHPISTEAATLQYFDRWSDTPVTLRETDSYTETRQQISSKEDDSFSEAEDGDNVVLLKKHGTSPSVESVDQDYSLISFHERLRLSKKAYSGDCDRELQKPPSKEFTVDETGDWHAVEDSSDYEIVERS